MKRQFAASFVVLALALSACALVNLGTPAASAVTEDAQTTTSTVIAEPIGASPTYEGCYYVWSSKDLPELSQKVGRILEAMDSNATGNAYAYGEDCVFADGHSTFSAMETDFRVSIKVKNLRDEEAMGNWIFKVMQAIEQLPHSEIQGGQPGRVEFQFIAADSETLFLNVSIDQYRRDADGKTGAELFRLFNTNP